MKISNKKPIIIAIGGCSNSGKSMLAKNMAKYLSDKLDKKVTVFCQDDFTYPTADIPKIKNHTNWEIPESINYDNIKKAIINELSTNDVIIIEGHIIYHLEELCRLFDKKLFIKINKDTFLKRKHNDFRWGKEPEWYIEHIWESYLKYGQPPNNKDILFIDGSKEFKVEEVLEKTELL